MSLFPATAVPICLAQADVMMPVAPMAILGLCVLAALGTVLLLPGQFKATMRGLGGVLIVAAAIIFALAIGRMAAGRTASEVYFWIFSAMALIGAGRVVTHSRPVYSALYFVMTVFASAGLFILLQAEFMAAALVLIYAGAILITYVFVIMLAASSSAERAAATLASYDENSREPIVAAVVGFALMGILLFVIFDKADGSLAPAFDPMAATNATAGLGFAVVGQTQELGAYLFQNQLLNLEVGGLILTLAMVGAIVIARRQVVTFDSAAQVPHLPPRPGIAAAINPIDDNPHAIPVTGTENPAQKAYPET